METYTTNQLVAAVERYTNGRAFVPFLTNIFCPTVMTFDTEKVSFDKVLRNKRLAPYVSPVIAGKANVQDGFQTVEYKPPYVKPKDVVQPSQFMTRRAGEQFNGTLSPAQRLIQCRIDLLVTQDQSIAMREEEMVSQMVQTGKVIAVGENFPTQEIDYGMSASNNITLTGGSRWSQLAKTSTQPRDDIETWADACKVAPDMIIFGSNAEYLNFVSFDCIKDVIDTTYRGNEESRFDRAASNGEYVQYKGMYGDYAIYVYKGAYDDADGNPKTFLDASRLLLCSSNTAGAMLYGAIQHLRALTGMSRFPTNWEQEDPSVEFIMTQSAPLPALPSIDDLVSVDLDGGA